MRVCLVCEGSYPYTPGGVSSWVHMLCTHFSDIEFVIWSIVASGKDVSDYAYKLPDNVISVETVCLDEAVFKKSGKKVRLSDEESDILKSLIMGSGENIDWVKVVELAKKYKDCLSDVLMSKSFFDLCIDEYQKTKSTKVFLSFLWNFRGIYYPLLYLLSRDIPSADLYHSVSCGYAGVLGSCASYVKGVPLLLSEHGIYTREREEDIIRSQWVTGEFKELWISFFRKLSFITYGQSSIVTTLFDTNRCLQIELGCPPDKIRIIPNGVDPSAYDKCCVRNNHVGVFTIGAVVRVVPIKDIKTMLLAFDIVKRQLPNSKLLIMGNTLEDEQYYGECLDLVKEMGTEDVNFLGLVDVKKYLPEVNLLVLSSISEGQPLAMLEGMSACLPFVATNVGDCKSLIEGCHEDDNFGSSGVVVPVMDSECMAKHILRLAYNPDLLNKMGNAGRMRVEKYYKVSGMFNSFRSIYKDLSGGI